MILQGCRSASWGRPTASHRLSTEGAKIRADSRRRASTPGTAARARGKPEPKFLYLTTTGRRTGLPREIEIWFTRNEGRYYLVAETGERAQWVMNVRKDPRVRWRVGRAAFSGQARVVNRTRERALVAEVRARSTAKYGWGDGVVVELCPGRARRASR
jgi:deazaflavin-dependent oxidoreductase (nitroreductase family)